MSKHIPRATICWQYIRVMVYHIIRLQMLCNNTLNDKGKKWLDNISMCFDLFDIELLSTSQ